MMRQPVRHWRHSQLELATCGEQIVAAGSADEVTGQLGERGLRVDEVIDLPGASVLPGMVDAHLHTGLYARSLTEVDLRGAADLSEVLARLRVRAATLPADEPLRGGGWEWQKWSNPVVPNAHDLDSVVHDRPVLLESQDRHTLWVNSVVLHRLGLPTDGDQAGILREAEGWEARERLGETAQPLGTALANAIDTLLAMGVTSVHDVDGEDTRAAFTELRARDALALRVVKFTGQADLDLAIAERRRTGAGDAWFREGHIKIFSDGALGSLTCHMCDPFQGTTTSGVASITDADLVDVITRSQAAGLGTAVHAIGDRANQQVLDAFAAAAATRPPGLRHRIEHAQHLRRVDVPRFAELDVVASLQPTHAISDMGLVAELLGDRDIASYACGSLLRSGALIAFGSDGPVEHPNPFWAVDAAVHRSQPDGTPAGGWQPEERLTLQQAIWAHTTGGHRAAGNDHLLGSLAVGRLADFVVVDKDLSGDSPDPTERVRDTQVLLTVVGGQIRFSAT